MKEERINEALKYADATNKIENKNMTKEELKNLKEELLKNDENTSFLYNLVARLKKRDVEVNGKNRR